MKRVVIVHGYNSKPSGLWFPWLKKELEVKGYSVIVPELPKPLLPNHAEWLATLERTVGAVDNNTIIIAHSLGTITALHYLESRPETERCHGFIAVAPFVRKRYGILVGDFFDNPPHFEKLRKRIPHIMVFSDPKDHLVPFADAEYLVEQMQCEFEVCGKRGHFDSRLNGITEVPEILGAVLEIDNRD